jgi:hypothetical protein
LSAVDPLQLWNTFDRLDSTILVSFPALGDNADAARICTCVMLLNLKGLREAPFMPSKLLPLTEQTSLFSQAFSRVKIDGVLFPEDNSKRVPFDPYNPWFADQGIYHVVWTYHKDLFRHLSLRWDITHCRNGYGLTLGSFGSDDRGQPDGDSVTETEQMKRQHEVERAGDGFLSPGILHL